MLVPPTVQSVCWFVFDPKWTAVNELNDEGNFVLASVTKDGENSAPGYHEIVYTGDLSRKAV